MDEKTKVNDAKLCDRPHKLMRVIERRHEINRKG